MIIRKILPIIVVLICSLWNSSVVFADGEDESVAEKETLARTASRFWKNWKEAFSVYIPIGSTLELIKQPDPMESLNRKIFVFNDAADRHILVPIVKGYKQVTPDVLEQGVSNVFSNFLEISTIINDVLQLKFAQGASDTGRLLVNSTIGIAGIFDVATAIGLEKHEEDFGQTLGHWGVPAGPYVMVPLFGPYTFRSGLGALADVNTSYIGDIEDVSLRNQVWALSIIDKRAGLLAAEELISGDRYSFIRDVYTQNREFLVADGIVAEDDFGEDDFDDWDE